MKKEVKQKALPTGWREVRLGEVVEIIGGGTPKTEVSEYWDGSIPWLTPPDFVNSNRWVNNSKTSITKLGLNSSPTKLLQKGDLIFSARGTVGAVAQLEKPMAFSQTSYGLRVKPEIVISDFLFYLLRHNRKRIQKLSYGATFDTVTTKTFNFIAILLPSLTEQKAIASLLEKWDTAIEKTEALIAAKEKRFKWLLKTLISDQQDNPEWRKVKLGKVIEDIGDGGTPSRKNSDYFGGGIPWVVIDDITFKIEKTKETLSKLGLSKSTAKIWPKGSVIVSTGATIGHVGIAKIPMATKQGITGIIPKKSITSEYLAYFLLAHTHLLIKYAQGSSFKEIRPETTKKIAFSYPEINLQKDMVSKLNTAQKETDMLGSLAEQYRTQKRGLMQKLLTGKWRLTPSLPRKQE